MDLFQNKGDKGVMTMKCSYLILNYILYLRGEMLQRTLMGQMINWNTNGRLLYQY